MVGAMKHALSEIGRQIVQVYPFTCPKCGKKNTETVPRLYTLITIYVLMNAFLHMICFTNCLMYVFPDLGLKLWYPITIIVQNLCCGIESVSN